MSSQPTAAEIAASIDTNTAEGHNLRALLLRLEVGGGQLFEGAEALPFAVAASACIRLGLIADGGEGLSDLGAEVAELLRPLPWRVTTHNDGRSGVARGMSPTATIRCDFKSDAEGIAALLTRDELDKAKQYRTDETP